MTNESGVHHRTPPTRRHHVPGTHPLLNYEQLTPFRYFASSVFLEAAKFFVRSCFPQARRAAEARQEAWRKEASHEHFASS